MNEHQALLQALADTIADYRADELAQPTSDHVERWIGQFERDVQDPLLRELNHVLQRTYFSKSHVKAWLSALARAEALAGNSPKEFWGNVNFLSVQQDGESQLEMLRLLAAVLMDEWNCDLEQSKSENVFVYLDDGLFSGNRIIHDVKSWLTTSAPPEATLHIIVIAAHSLGIYYLNRDIPEAAREAGKRLTFKIWRSVEFENRKYFKYVSDVLWPAVLPDNDALTTYINAQQKYPFEPRPAGGKPRLGLFSSEANRQMLESELLLAGVKIRSFSANPAASMKPLGYSGFGLGFGSLLVTFRNCPNNCPLALWWGDPTKGAWHPLSKWYPLFPRKTYDRDSMGGIWVPNDLDDVPF